MLVVQRAPHNVGAIVHDHSGKPITAPFQKLCAVTPAIGRTIIKHRY